MDQEVSDPSENAAEHASTSSEALPLPTKESTDEPKEALEKRSDTSVGDVTTNNVNTKSSFYNETYKLKKMTVETERCDKIWETLQLIRNMQGPRKRTQDEMKSEERTGPAPKVARKSTTCKNFPAPSIRPVAAAANLPKGRKKRVYSCPKCGKNYAENRSMRHHAFRVHCHFIPLQRNYRKKVATVEPPAKTPVKVAEPVKLERLKIEDIATASSSRRMSKTRSSIATRTSMSTKAPMLKQKAAIKVNLKVNPSPLSNEAVKCMLCQRQCKNIRKHIIEYHKILYPELIVKNCIDQSQEENVLVPTSKPEPSPPAPSQPTTSVGRRKFVTPKVKALESWQVRRKYTNPKHRDFNFFSRGRDTDSGKFVKKTPPMSNKHKLKAATLAKIQSRKRSLRQCNICLGMYVYTSFSRHMKCHKLRGETRENIHLIKVRYKNAVLKGNFKKGVRSQAMIKNEEEEDEGAKEVSAIIGARNNNSHLVSPSESRNSNESSETICECGRTFRNPYHLYMHKAKCKNAEESETGRTTSNSSDRDSGIGISITIKKKNNSYEIVNKESGEEDRDTSNGEASNLGSDATFLDKENSTAADKAKLPHSKVFQETSVMKIETVEDDVDVEIEEVEVIPVEVKEEVVERVLPKKPELTILSRLTLEDYEKEVQPSMPSRFKTVQPRKPPPELNFNRNKLQGLSCFCSKVFKGPRAERFLDVHARTKHPDLLKCRFCKIDFLTFMEYRKHSCPDIGTFDESLFQIKCPLCEVKVDITSEKFDAHVKSEHHDPEHPVMCFICAARWKDVNQRSLHVSKTHQQPPCEICGKKLTFDAKIRHDVYHQGAGFACHICKCSFSLKVDQQTHHLSRHAGKEWRCSMCSKVFKKNSYRTVHMQTHHKPPKICKLCGTGMYKFEQLKVHVERKHRDNYPYATCDNCQTQFIEDEGLKTHIESGECSKFLNSDSTEDVDVEGI